MPVIREPTDFIPNSADSSKNTSREVTLSTINKSEESADPAQTKENPRPKVVSVFCRQHDGQQGSAPYSIKPSQMVYFNSPLNLFLEKLLNNRVFPVI